MQVLIHRGPAKINWRVLGRAVVVALFYVFVLPNRTLCEDKNLPAVKFKTAYWAERYTIEGGDGHEQRIQCVAFSPDGSIIATASIDATVKIWDVATGKLKVTISMAKDDRPSAVAFSPDGKTLAFGRFSDPWVTIADPTSGKVLGTLTDPKYAKINGPTTVRCLAFTRDGKTLAAGGQDDQIRLWDPSTRILKHQFRAGMYSIDTLAFSPDERTLAAAGTTIRMWDMTTRKEVGEITGLQETYCVAFSPDGALLASAGTKNDIKLWDTSALKEGKVVKEVASFRFYEQEKQNGATCVAFTHDGKTLVAGSGNEDEGTLQFIDTTTRKVRESIRCARLPNSLAISPDGKVMAIGTYDRTDVKNLKTLPPRLIICDKVPK